MVVKMKSYEALAIEFASQYDNWELQCVSKDGYLEGYRQAIEDIDNIHYEQVSQCNVPSALDKEVEVDFPSGSHQLIADSRMSKPNEKLIKWKKGEI